MAIAAAAEHLGAMTEKRIVRPECDCVWRDRLPETWPTGAGFEFGIRTEEFETATDADIGSRRVIVPIFAREGPFGPLFSRDPVLFGRELRFPLRIGFDYLV